MAPARPTERIEVIDILRGVSILGVILMNMLGYAGYGTPFQEMQAVNRVVVWLITFFVQAKFYTLLSFLFGWGMATQMERAASRGRRFVPLYVRRLLALLLIGLVHAILIWDGDILVTYALLGFPLLLFRKRSDRTLLIAVVVCMLIPVLISTPGPGETFRAAYARLTEPLRHQPPAGIYTEGSYLEFTLHRLQSLRSFYSQAVYWATHVFGMFLLGLYAGRRRIFHNISAHLPLFRQVMWGGLIVGVVCNLIFVSVSASPGRVSVAYYPLATRGARTIGGPALCLFYISAIVLLVQRRAWRDQLAPFAAVGRMALSNYLAQSVFCTLFFYGYGLGVYGKLGPTITLVLTLVIYRVQMALSGWWLERYQFGPAEWLWRSLSYGRLQPLKPRKRAARTVAAPAEPSQTASEPPRKVGQVVLFVLRRPLFIAVVAFVIVYFCILGMRLNVNSSVRGTHRSVWNLAEPALDETFDFFADVIQGDLGIGRDPAEGASWTSLADLLAESYGNSAQLLAISIVLATLLGIAAGGLAALRRHSPLALSTLTVTVIGVSIPSFFLALLIMIGSIEFYQLTGVRLVLFGPRMSHSQALLPRVVLPALVLTARPLAHITRVTFISISEVLERDYIRTARAKGVPALLVFWTHTLRNAGISILTAVVISLRFALGSMPVAEIFFNWPGLGVTMLNGIYQRDVRVVAGSALLLGVSFLLINMALDLLYRFIDPRLRDQENGGGG
jgi:uncharacterized protein